MRRIEQVFQRLRKKGDGALIAYVTGGDPKPKWTLKIVEELIHNGADIVELGIPFCIQLGHSLELLPSGPGRPLLLDKVALEFPDLTIIGSHTGWPWCEEMIAVAWKHPNVYMDISAHLPRYLDESVKQFMTTRGQNKVLFGTNGIGLERCLTQFDEIPMKDEVRKKILRDNVIRLFNL